MKPWTCTNAATKSFVTSTTNLTNCSSIHNPKSTTCSVNNSSFWSANCTELSTENDAPNSNLS